MWNVLGAPTRVLINTQHRQRTSGCSEFGGDRAGGDQIIPHTYSLTKHTCAAQLAIYTRFPNAFRDSARSTTIIPGVTRSEKKPSIVAPREPLTRLPIVCLLSNSRSRIQNRGGTPRTIVDFKHHLACECNIAGPRVSSNAASGNIPRLVVRIVHSVDPQ